MFTKTAVILGLSACLLAAPAFSAHHETGEMAKPDYAALLASAERDDRDKARDEGRKPAEVLAKMGLYEGDVVIDIGSGGGYYADVFARAVGPTGKVYAVNDADTLEKFPRIVEVMEIRMQRMGNLFPTTAEYHQLDFGEPASAVFMGQMYHEVIRQDKGAEAINTAVYNALKPGGLYVIEIHRAEEGAGAEVTDTYHRADPAMVRTDVLAAGFELVEENTTLLGNPDDPLTIGVFDDSIRGKTARTLFFFQKPAE